MQEWTIKELGEPITLGTIKDISDIDDINLEIILKECKIFFGCFELGLICELNYVKTENNYLCFETLEYDSSGYICWGGCEIVIIHNNIIYMRKFFNDKFAFEQKKDISIAFPIVFENELNENNYQAYLESTFDGFDGIDINFKFTLNWIKSLYNNNSNLKLFKKV